MSRARNDAGDRRVPVACGLCGLSRLGRGPGRALPACARSVIVRTPAYRGCGGTQAGSGTIRKKENWASSVSEAIRKAPREEENVGPGFERSAKALQRRHGTDGRFFSLRPSPSRPALRAKRPKLPKRPSTHLQAAHHTTSRSTSLRASSWFVSRRTQACARSVPLGAARKLRLLPGR